jgi:DNA-binding MarR family transcriptional regulator
VAARSAPLAAPRARSAETSAADVDPKSDDAVAAVEHALTRLMRQANRPAVYRTLLADAGFPMDRADYGVLLRIGEAPAPIRLTDLADVLGVDISTASRQVRDLERAGLIERSDDPDDQRASRLRLSAQGEAALNRVRAARQVAMRNLLVGWSRDDQLRLAKLVGRLAERMEALTR